MKFDKKLIVIVLFPFVALMVIFLSQGQRQGVERETLIKLADANRFLGFVVAAYIANYLIAWKFQLSSRVSIIRMLIFGVIAYVCLSNAIDIFLDYRNLTGEIIGYRNFSSENLVKALRANLGAWSMSLVMSCICIGIGFEKEKQ